MPISAIVCYLMGIPWWPGSGGENASFVAKASYAWDENIEDLCQAFDSSDEVEDIIGKLEGFCCRTAQVIALFLCLLMAGAHPNPIPRSWPYKVMKCQ
jgi:hypothetical protein